MRQEHECKKLKVLNLNVFRTLPKSKRNIPAAAGSADEATTSTTGCCNGNGPSNGVSGESDEDMEVN